ncbi:hypothetical protein F5887DRAFT_49076 [Amanita rubescens]|nr:hypothetical protein F5887DRAFT_49076 [Amanita rubescens]
MAPCFPWIPSPTGLLGMTDAELAAFEADIIVTCAEHKQNHWRDVGYRACVTIESKKSKYFIKFDHPKALWPEFLTQSYIYDYAMRHRNGPRIPQALHYFDAQVEAFLVMEYIELTHSPLITNLAERAAWALDWLSRVPAPPEDVMGPSKDAVGPIGGGLIRHRFFKDHKAPLAFSSIDALERYMNEGRKLLSKLARNPAKPIVIINDPLIFTQSDMHISNFGVDECGNTVLLDFGAIGRLPLSFAKYTMGSGGDGSFIASVANILRWPDNSNLDSMARVSYCLWMASNPKLGLDKDGRRKPKSLSSAYAPMLSER